MSIDNETKASSYYQKKNFFFLEIHSSFLLSSCRKRIFLIMNAPKLNSRTFYIVAAIGNLSLFLG